MQQWLQPTESCSARAGKSAHIGLGDAGVAATSRCYVDESALAFLGKALLHEGPLGEARTHRRANTALDSEAMHHVDELLVSERLTWPNVLSDIDRYLVRRVCRKQFRRLGVEWNVGRNRAQRLECCRVIER